jgi:hypothetical protein
MYIVTYAACVKKEVTVMTKYSTVAAIYYYQRSWLKLVVRQTTNI